ncbi:hypothetical protein ACF08N_32665 [Streptomyces sp. NPDC015127]|uniref:hypothetical protein n=1 Tax=Streptomyces sp. NPDC015127 TaxID=3364939 RepID=UPI0036FEBAB4
MAEMRLPRTVREADGPLIVFVQELSMADGVFVVTTIAVFALVAFIAKGVAKL